VSEAVYLQVEDAIARELHISGRYRTPLGGLSYEYPVAIEDGNIVLRDGDCGLSKGVRIITTDEWAKLARGGLWRRVGMWSFTLADDPAASDIAWCHRSPEAAGYQLHRLRCEVERLTKLLAEGPTTEGGGDTE
jgi:hypothetical protein